MAIKAAVEWRDIEFNNDGIDFSVRVWKEGAFVDDVVETELHLGASGTTLNNAIMEAGKTIATEQLDVTFGLLDTIMLLNPIDALLS